MLLLFILPNSVCKGFEGLTTTNLWRKAESEMWFSGRAGASMHKTFGLIFPVPKGKKEKTKQKTMEVMLALQ